MGSKEASGSMRRRLPKRRITQGSVMREAEQVALNSGVPASIVQIDRNLWAGP